MFNEGCRGIPHFSYYLYILFGSMMKTSRLLRNAIPCIIGIVFLFSGMLKAADSAHFADIMSQYGFVCLGYAAPCIILGEIILGLALLFRVFVRPATWITLSFLIGVTIIFAYGVLVRGITDCGCFGHFTILNSHPWLTFLRNTVFAALLVGSLAFPPEQKELNLSILSFSALVLGVAAYLCGFSLHGAQILKSRPSPFKPIPLCETKIPQFLNDHTNITLSSDSSYLIFAFSYTCPFCKNSIGNVEQYEKMDYVDKTIGLAMGSEKDSINFVKVFQPTFEIYSVPQLPQLISSFPTSFLICRDTLVNITSGMVISPAFFISDDELSD